MRSITRFLPLLVLVAFSPAALTAQASQPQFYNSIETALTGDDGSQHIVFYGESSVSGLPGIWVQRRTPDGQLTTFPLLSQGTPLNYDVLAQTFGYVAVINAFECDIITGWDLYQYDLMGNVIWAQKLHEPTDPDRPIKLLPGPGGSFWVLEDGELPQRFDNNGTLLETASVALPLFHGFRKTAAGRLLTYGHAGLALYSTDLQSIQFAWQGVEFFAAAVLPNGNIAALSADSLWLLDEDLLRLNAVANGLPPVGVQRTMAYGDGLIQVLSMEQNAKFLLQFNPTTLDLVQSLDIPAGRPFQPRFILPDPSGGVLLAGEERRLGNMGTQVLELRTVAPGAMPDLGATADAGLLSLATPKLPKGVNLGQPAPAYSILLDTLLLELRNDGAAPLQQVNINGILNTFFWFCGQESILYRKTFFNLGLAPGESIQLVIDSLQWGGPGLLPASANLCFWTTLPNDSLDANADNNRVCQSVQIVVSDKTPHRIVQTLAIAPNPARDQTLLTWGSDAYGQVHIQMFDAAGALLAEYIATGNQWQLPLQNLTAGLYQVLVRTAEGRLFAGRLSVK